MVITATDQTSGIAWVQYRINNGSWQVPTPDGDVWAFTFTPSNTGAQTIYVRASDKVGNQSTTSKSFTIDNIFPTISLDSPPISSINRGDTTLLFSGPVSDNAGGSGVASVYVELLDQSIQPVGAPILATLLPSNRWQTNASAN
jgi:hypothetical protein